MPHTGPRPLTVRRERPRVLRGPSPSEVPPFDSVHTSGAEPEVVVSIRLPHPDPRKDRRKVPTEAEGPYSSTLDHPPGGPVPSGSAGERAVGHTRGAHTRRLLTRGPSRDGGTVAQVSPEWTWTEKAPPQTRLSAVTRIPAGHDPC